MPTVIGHHDVKDTEHWLASPKREEVFRPLGVTNIRTFVKPQNRTPVAVLMDVADLDVVMAAMTTPIAKLMRNSLPKNLVRRSHRSSPVRNQMVCMFATKGANGQGPWS